MKKWLVPLSGNSQVLYNFSNWVRSADFKIYEDSEDHLADAYFLESPHLDGLEKQQIIENLKGLLELINGAVALHWGFNNAFSLHKLSFVDLYFSDTEFPHDGDYSIATHMPQIANVPACSPFSKKVPLKSQIESCGDIISARVRMAESNEAVTVLLRQASAGFDWRNLYSIWDTVIYFCGGEKEAIKELNIDINKKSAFTGTANSFAVLGPAARHGEKGWKVPKNLMTLDEANEFIHSLTVNYLDKFHCINCYKKELVKKHP